MIRSNPFQEGEDDAGASKGLTQLDGISNGTNRRRVMLILRRRRGKLKLIQVMWRELRKSYEVKPTSPTIARRTKTWPDEFSKVGQTATAVSAVHPRPSFTRPRQLCSPSEGVVRRAKHDRSTTKALACQAALLAGRADPRSGICD